MSHSHIRAVVPKTSEVIPLWLRLFAGACVVLIVAITILFVTHPDPELGPVGGYRTAEGKILQTRIVIDHAKVHGALPAKPQDEQFATKAPKLPE